MKTEKNKNQIDKQKKARFAKNSNRNDCYIRDKPISHVLLAFIPPTLR